MIKNEKMTSKFKMPLVYTLVNYAPIIGALLLCAVVVFFASALRVNAEETTEQYTYTFSYSYYDTRDTATLDPAHYDIVQTITSEYELHMFIEEDSNGYVWLKWYSPDIELQKIDSKKLDIPFSFVTSKDGVVSTGTSVIQYYNGFPGASGQITKALSFAINPTSTSAIQDIKYSFTGKIFSSYESATAYATNNDDSGQVNKHIPDFDSASKNNTFGLNNYTATVYGDTLTVTWNGVSSRKVDISDYSNTYVKSKLLFCPVGSNGVNEVVTELSTVGINDNGFVVDLSQYVPNEDYYLYSVESVPYYYAGDDITSTLYSGVVSSYHWDENGNIVTGNVSSDFVESVTGIYDDSIGIITNLQIDKIAPKDCHDSVDGFTNCFSLSWDVTNFDTSSYTEYYEMKFQMQYAYSLTTSTSLLYRSGLFNYSKDGNLLCVPVLNGTYNFCGHDFCEISGLNNELSLFDGSVSSFNIQDVSKIYVRCVRQNKYTKDITYGDWALIDIDWRSNILNTPVVGATTIYSGGSSLNNDGSVDSDILETIEPPENDSDFSFAGIDLTDISSIGGYFIGLLESLINIIGHFPTLFATVFSFLPYEIRNMLYVFLVTVVVVGLFKIFV